jgi:hypothetical protein
MIMTSTGKSGYDELDDERVWVPTKCNTCFACHLDVKSFEEEGLLRCYYGGPFTHFEKVPDDAPSDDDRSDLLGGSEHC